MHLDAGGGHPKRGHEFVVRHEGIHHRAQMVVADRIQEFIQLVEQQVDVLAGPEMKIRGVVVIGGDGGDVIQNHLQTALIELNLAFHSDQIAAGHMRHRFLGDIPHHAVDLTGVVAERRQEIQVRVTVGSELFVGEQKDLVNRFTIMELFEKLAGHRNAI